MRTARKLSHWLSLAVAVVLFAPPALALGEHEDERLGYRIRFPKHFNQIPIQSDEEWVVAKFQLDEQTTWVGGPGNWTFRHTPEVQVVAFLKELIFRDDTEQDVEGEEIEDNEGGGAGGSGPKHKEIKKEKVDPYRDYLDYMRRTFTRGGWYVAEEDATTVNGFDVTCYSIAVEKPDRGGPLRIETWVYETPLGQIAVQAEMHASAWSDLKRPIQQLLRSFAPIERTEGLALDAVSGLNEAGFGKDLEPGERARRRIAAEEQAWKQAVSGLPKDWTEHEIDGVRVLNHANRKLANKIADRVNATWEFLDKTFPDIGPEEYARKPTVRICQDYDEERAFRQGRGGTDWGALGLEIVTRKDNYAGSNSYQWTKICRHTLEIWFKEHDPLLYAGMPEWLRYGMSRMIGEAELKGGKLRLDEIDWEKDALRDAKRDGKLIEAKSLMRLTDSAINSYIRKRDWGPPAQVIALTRFMVGDPGRKRPEEGLLDDYFKHLKDVAAIIEAEREAAEAAEVEPETEEEEQKLLRDKRSARRRWERQLLDEAFSRTFTGWSERDWKKFETSFSRAMR